MVQEPATQLPLSARIRLAAADVQATAASAAGHGVVELKSKGSKAAADAKWGVLCSTPAVQAMQQQRSELADTKKKRKQMSVIEHMRRHLDASRGCAEPVCEDAENVKYEERERVFRYDSLNEHLVQLSLSRAIKRREWKRVFRLSLGWLLNHFFFTALLLVFAVYGCVFDEQYGDVNDSSELLLSSWAWSIMQRFAVNEPFLIVMSVVIPLLFATECCANMCTESCNNFLGVAVAMLITFMKRMRRA